MTPAQTRLLGLLRELAAQCDGWPLQRTFSVEWRIHDVCEVCGRRDPEHADACVVAPLARQLHAIYRGEWDGVDVGAVVRALAAYERRGHLRARATWRSPDDHCIVCGEEERAPWPMQHRATCPVPQLEGARFHAECCASAADAALCRECSPGDEDEAQGAAP